MEFFSNYYQLDSFSCPFNDYVNALVFKGCDKNPASFIVQVLYMW